MPGTLWRVSCDSCHASWEVQAGALPERSFLPAQCIHCVAIVTAEKATGAWRCTRCETALEPLPGAVLEPGRELRDPVGVGCPICTADGLRAYECGLWD